MKDLLIKKLEEKKCRSAWSRGVREYAIELIENLKAKDFESLHSLYNAMLNGARDWNEYSWGGCSLIYDGDIAERLCTPSELKKTRNGERQPNNREEWLDVQARALYQASNKVMRAYKEIKEGR